MITFITSNSNLVPLIEGLCSSSSCGFEFSVLCSHLLLFVFANFFSRKRAVSPRSQPASQHIYILMCTLYTYTNTYMPKLSPSGFFEPSKCLTLTPGLTSECPTRSVRACARIHTHALPPPPKNSENTDISSIFPYFKKKRSTPARSA